MENISDVAPLIAIFLLSIIALMIVVYGSSLRNTITKLNKSIGSLPNSIYCYFQDDIRHQWQLINQLDDNANELGGHILGTLVQIEEHQLQIKNYLSSIKKKVEEDKVAGIAIDIEYLDKHLEQINIDTSEILRKMKSAEPLPRNPDLKENPFYQSFMDELDDEKKR